MTMSGNEVVFAIIIILTIILFTLKPILKNIRGSQKIIANAAIGWGVLILIHMTGAGIGFYLPINLATLVISGIFGLPGVILLIILKIILH